MTPLAFVDTETTGLHPSLHHIWEVGLIIADAHGETEHHWFLDPPLGDADPFALGIGRYYERHPSQGGVGEITPVAEFVAEFVARTADAHLVGAVVSFDADRLDRLIREYGELPRWHYHLVDVEALAAGALGCPPPWKSSDLSDALGVPMPDDTDRHTALGDARWARDVYIAALAHREWR